MERVILVGFSSVFNMLVATDGECNSSLPLILGRHSRLGKQRTKGEMPLLYEDVARYYAVSQAR